ncbi:MAG: sulfatase-like hydrolase/transferase [Planctomycetes bacterium]|nr:sulfatase-like hydrolase/transferase [Planctomycetota bacterium]
MPSSEPRTRGERVRALAFSWLVGSAVGVLAGWSWISSLPLSSSKAWIFAHAALASTAATLAVIPLLLLAPLFLRPRPVPGAAWIQAFVWSLFGFAVFADTRVFALFRYHVNGMVWNLVTTGGAGDAVQIPLSNWLVALGVCALACVLLARLFGASASWWSAPGRAARCVRIGAWSVFAVVLLEKGLFAHADLFREREVTVLARCFPLYQRLTIERLAVRVFGMNLAARPSVALAGEGLFLHYPLAQPTPDPAGPRPNVLVVVIDSLRADAFRPEVMPELTRFAQHARVFQNHLSGGNATRYGLFTLLYGLYGSYWMPVLDENAPPVLITTLAQQGYDLHAFSGPTLSSPEFRSTAFVSMEAQVDDAYPQKQKYERDEYLAQRFRDWNRTRRANGAARPFFAFALLDSPHQAYSYPPGGEVFRPSAGDVDYMAMSSSPSPEQIQAVRNRYLNAVHHADHVLSELLADLEASGELANTIVCVTGDHGEEFLEHGYFGHTSNFTPEQVHVTFVLGGPGIEPGVETRPTSHLDLAPTLLEQLGVPASARGDYSNGLNLLDPPAQRVRVVSGWDEAGMWIEKGILRVPLEGHRGAVEALGFDGEPYPDEDALLEKSAPLLRQLAEDCRRFLR